ncbi:MAG: hypothetical protein IPM48_07205 [Saprospiraceae bacterium]|nr:hypothetical protein [Saprospiraceae bacterium]
MGRNFFFVSILLWTIVFANSCRNALYKEEITVDPIGWTYDQEVKFKWNVKDTSLLYDILLKLEHTIDLKYQNVYVKAITSIPNQADAEQILSLELLHTNGIPVGDCYGNHCRAALVLNEKIRFPSLGEYSLKLQQNSRQDSLPGLKSLSLEIVQSKL